MARTKLSRQRQNAIDASWRAAAKGGGFKTELDSLEADILAMRYRESTQPKGIGIRKSKER
jgi:hypothetical protein